MKRLIFSTKALWHQWRAFVSRALAPAQPEPAEPDQPIGCSTAAQMLLASLVGVFIAGLWIWISARAGG